MKNSIAFIAVAFFVFGSSQALAYVPGVWDPQPQAMNTDIPFAFYPVPVSNQTQFVTQNNPTYAPTVTSNPTYTPTTVAVNQNVNYYTPSNTPNNNVPNDTSNTSSNS